MYANVGSVRFGNSAEAVQDIFSVFFPDAKIVADLTYGKGRFWRWNHAPAVIGMDVDVHGGADIRSEYQNVPLQDQSVDVAVFDPPFIFTPGIRGLVGAKRFFLGSEATTDGRFYRGARSDARIVAPKNAFDLERQTYVVMREMRRIARHGCILKGQNLITGEHPNWWTHQIYRAGLTLWGVEPNDELIQVSKAARLVDPRWKNQFHFRRHHSYYVIYKFRGSI